MFMRINWGRLKPGKWDDYERLYRQAIAEGITGKATRRWLLRDLADPDAGYAVSLWESEADMREYSQDPELRGRIEDLFKDVFIGEYTTKLCEVRLGDD